MPDARAFRALAVAAAFALLPGTSAGAAVSEVPPARDGNIAIKEELCAARKANTVKAYDLFIARHPDHPLAETARKLRARLMAKKPD